jgi:hypothetical protein
VARKKSDAGTWADLPDRVFISHAYDDQAAVDRLRKKLPARVSGVIFPPRRDPKPWEAVSEGIVPAIRECQGLIWIAGGASARSFWVEFERDYALRSGLSVFRFHPASEKLDKTSASPLPLRVEVFVSEDGLQRAAALLKWMKEERSFDFEERPRVVRQKEIPGLVARLIHEGRIAVWLMDGYMGAIAQCALEVPLDDLCYAYCRIPGASNVREPEEFDRYADWLNRHSMYVRLTPEWQPIAERDPEAWKDPETRHFVLTEFPIEGAFGFSNDLQRIRRSRRSYDGSGRWMVDLTAAADAGGFNRTRADDLIVQLIHMLRNAEPFFDDEDEEDR